MVDHRCYTPAIAALAGRRIDAHDADEVRFPLAEAKNVFNKLLHRFRQDRIEHLVCSAACGADLIALEAAEKLAIASTVILPFSSHTFRCTSVTDRPGNWGECFDRMVADARAKNNLIELDYKPGDERGYLETNRKIIHWALNSGYQRKLAFVVWEGRSRGEGDSTADFLSLAISQGFEKRVVLSIGRGE